MRRGFVKCVMAMQKHVVFQHTECIMGVQDWAVIAAKFG
jgi:hypothetical protein